MTCHQVQSNLSLYLYGELDFAIEDAVEDHLVGCAFCQRALAREKSWHASLNAEEPSVPLDLLSECRQELRVHVAKSLKLPNELPSVWHRWWDGFHLLSSAWPARVSAAILLMALGFGAGRWAERGGFESRVQFARPAEAGFVAPYIRVRDIQPSNGGKVRIVIDRIQQSELTGPISDDQVRQALLTGTRDPADPAIRVDSLDFLRGQTGSDVRDALLVSVLQDRNAAVRLKALEGLRPFAADLETRRTLVEVLKNDDNAGVRAEAIDVLLPPTPSVDVTPDLLRMLQQVYAAQQENDYVRMRCTQALGSAKAAAEVY